MWSWKPYVTVEERRQKALKKITQLQKKGTSLEPITIEGRTIAKSFWGRAWSTHLESFADYENRLPRGRTYVRNGSVVHLKIDKGKVEALVTGSRLYNVEINFTLLKEKRWEQIKKACSGQVSSLLELLKGALSDGVMQAVSNHETGLFPETDEITFSCNCPDWAGMCKHVAATLYGIGAKFDHNPALLFELRGVDPKELIELNFSSTEKMEEVKQSDLSELFGIELDESGSVDLPSPAKEKKSPSLRLTGKELAALRKKKRLSLPLFAKKIGVREATVQKWEKSLEKIYFRPKVAESLQKLTHKKAMKK